MRSRFLLLFGGIAVVASSTPAAARQSAASLPRAGGISSVRPAPESARVNDVLSRADNATAAGRMGEARRLYRGIIREQRDASVYAGIAIWRLAANHIYDGDVTTGAQLLDDLADEAARYGDPTMQLRASFEAAVLWQQAKRQDLTQRNLERVRCLLQSPAISADLKATIEGRMVQ